MLAIPDLDGPTVAFGGIKHMPKYDTLPEEFQRFSSQRPHCRAVSMWFYKGAEFKGGKLTVDGMTFAPKSGVDADKALRAIRAVLGSFEPKHAHKIAACGYMLSEWFVVE